MTKYGKYSLTASIRPISEPVRVATLTKSQLTRIQNKIDRMRGIPSDLDAYAESLSKYSAN